MFFIFYFFFNVLNVVRNKLDFLLRFLGVRLGIDLIKSKLNVIKKK